MSKIDMPIFVIKAKDYLAMETVEHYRYLCEREGLYDQAAEVSTALDEMALWRGANPDDLKLPDHVHVPVGGGSTEFIGAAE